MTTMAGLLWPFLHKLWAFSLVFVPTIGVYLAVAQMSLKAWIAVQHAPRLPATTSEVLNSDSPERRRILGKILHLACRPSTWPPVLQSSLCALLLLIAWLIDYFSKANVDTKKMVSYGLLVWPGTFCVAQLPLRTSKLVVARTPSGAPFYLQVKENESWPALLFRIFIGVGITTAGLFEGSITIVHRICQALLYGAFLHVLLLGSVTSSDKYRALKLHIICTGLGGIAIIAIVICTIMFGEQHGSTSPTARSSGSGSNVDVFQQYSVLLQGVTWYWSYLCFKIIALCYKMDYTFAIESGRLAAPIVRRRATEGTHSDLPNSKQQVLVVQVHASFRPKFDKTYFNASIAGFASTAAFLAILTTYLEERGRSNIGYEWIPYYLSGVAAPVICSFILALAYRKGEFRKVWEYGERWMDIPEDIPLVGTEIESMESTPGLEFCEKEKVPGIEEKELLV